MSAESALTLGWAFGMNKGIGVVNLCDGNREAVFYAAAHTGVISGFGKSQKLLQGHCSPISCAVVSKDKKYIVTGDAGEDALIVVWNSFTGAPVRTIFGRPVLAVDFDDFSKFLVGLSSADQQELLIWEWGTHSPEPLITATLPQPDHRAVSFNPNDTRELVTTSATKVLYWHWNDSELTSYKPKLSRKYFRQPFGSFTMTCFLGAGTSQAATGTNDGVVVLWDTPRDHPEEDENFFAKKVATKVIRLCDGAVNHVSAIGPYLVVAGDDGAVRFYDFMFRLEPLLFGDDDDDDKKKKKGDSDGATQLAQQNIAELSQVCEGLPSFVVGTRRATIVHVDPRIFVAIRPDDRKGTVLVQGFSDEIHGLAVHPTKPIVYLACDSGQVTAWNYETKALVRMREFDDHGAKLAFDPNGTCLVVGLANGSLRFVDPTTLQDLDTIPVFKPTKEKITLLKFSDNGEYLAAADAVTNAVFLWKKRKFLNDDETIDETWVYIGRCLAHSEPVTGLDFGFHGAQNRPVLVSVGEDRNLVEYDLDESKVETGISVAGAHTIEETSIPTAVVSHPMLRGDFEKRLITANSDLKFRQWNAENKLCRATSLGPTFSAAAPVNKIVSLPRARDQHHDEQHSGFLAYATRSRVVGLVKMPLDGNPNKIIGLIGHAGTVAEIAATSNGKYLFTAGGTDETVNLWTVQTNFIDDAERLGGAGVDPYLSLLVPGNHTDDDNNTDLYDDLVDYFYYLQLRRQGESSTEKRQRNGTVRLADIPCLMRALGFYPSEAEITNILAEVRYSIFTSTGEIVEDISLDDFIKLYVNHRPTKGDTPQSVDLRDLQNALKTIQAYMENEQPDDTAFAWGNLRDLLISNGDKMSHDEISMCLAALQGNPNLDSKLLLTHDEFINDVLGFSAPTTSISLPSSEPGACPILSPLAT